MNQAELINTIATDTGHTKATVKAILDNLGAQAAVTLQAGDDVILPGIGKLHVKTRAARTGRNPATGKEIAIPKKRAVKLTVAKALKDAVA